MWSYTNGLWSGCNSVCPAGVRSLAMRGACRKGCVPNTAAWDGLGVCLPLRAYGHALLYCPQVVRGVFAYSVAPKAEALAPPPDVVPGPMESGDPSTDKKYQSL